MEVYDWGFLRRGVVGGGGGEGSVGSGLGRGCSGQMSIMNVPG